MNAYTAGYLARWWTWWNPWTPLMLAAASSWIVGYAEAGADIELPPIRREDCRLEPECRARVA